MVDVTGAHETILSDGWWRATSALSASQCRALLDRGEQQWRPLTPRVGRVDQRGWYCQPLADQVPIAVRLFADNLATALSMRERFNEITWQRHIPADAAISAHRDQSHYDDVIAIATLAGSARFAILESRTPRVELTSWATRPGDLVLLRGDGRCPWHEVDAPTVGERITLTLRHTAMPGTWA